MKIKPVVQTPAKAVVKPSPKIAKVTPKYVSAPVHKQEPKETPAPPEPTPLEACITEKMGQGMSEEEASNACKAELEGEKEPPPTEEKTLGIKPTTTVAATLETQVLGFMKEYGKKLIAEMKVQIDKDIKVAIQENRDALVGNIKKGLGLVEDPTVHLSEVEGMVRKILLDKEPHGKRTITETGEKPVEGAELTKSKAIVKPAADIYKSLMKNKGSI